MVVNQIVIGAWIQAAGTIINAIDPPFAEDDGKVIAKAGNVLQAVGSAVMADAITDPQSKFANEVQSVGNLVVITGLYKGDASLELKGNLIQAAGGSLALVPAMIENDYIAFQGDFLQVVGNSIQAISGIKEQRENVDASILDDVGAWAQAIGAVIAAIYLQREESISDELLQRNIR